MSTKPNTAVRLSKNATSTVKSTVRAKFNALVSKLEAERKRLAAWHDAMPRVRARAAAELEPMTVRFGECQRELIKVFDTAFTNKQIKKKEREKISTLICSLVLGLLDDGADEELEEILNRHSGADVLADDPEFLAFKEIMDKMMDEAGADGNPFGPPHEDQAEAPAASRGGARKAKGPTARQAEEAARLAQSVREIFRKLASALHPDRETDPAERIRKTALMQRANVAYAANDLLGLLELQFEVDQIDASKLDTLGEERIKQYNKVLTKQVDEVRREIGELEHWLMYDMHISGRGRVTPAMMEKSLEHEIAEYRVRLAGMERDVQEFQDIKVLKAFLKTYRIPEPFDFMEDDYY